MTAEDRALLQQVLASHTLLIEQLRDLRLELADRGRRRDLADDARLARHGA